MAVAGHGPNERNLDPSARLILGELRDLRAEMRADRQRADADRQRADADRQRSDEAWREERRASDERFESLMRHVQQDSARRELATQRAFKDIRTVGLSIVKTLNHHTRILERHGQILERIERTLVAWGPGGPGQGNGGGASSGR